MVADHMEGMLTHLTQRDVSLAVVSTAPIDKIEAFKKRMGWGFGWVSSYNNDFNWDHHVSFTMGFVGKSEAKGGTLGRRMGRPHSPMGPRCGKISPEVIS